ncbi:MAG TPA: hypothetical protein VFV83_11315, partial [Chthoniobacteraceae bacterium]|nr:hypothetical protein [Chthoniobacteraceae bacterium]
MSSARSLCILALLAAGLSLAHAQDKPRKKMTFYPGAPPAAPGAGPGTVAAANSEAKAATAVNPTGGNAGETTAPIDLSGQEAPGQIAGNFFALLQRGDVEKSYAELTRGSKIAER